MVTKHSQAKNTLYIVGGLCIMSMVGFFFFLCNAPPPPAPENPKYLDASLPIADRVEDLLSHMTPDEKIGQMALVEKNSIKQPSDISDYGLGALLSGSGARPIENTPASWTEMTNSYQAEATKSRLGIPLLYGSDAIHGHAHVSEVTVFPHMIGFGAAGSPELVQQVAVATAEQMRATGVNWNFAPNLDTPQDIRWGRVYETFSDDPTLASQLGSVYIQGLQSPTNESAGYTNILATPKHFVGLGGMGWGTSLNENFAIDQGVTAADDTLLQEVYLPPFQAAIEAGALSIMAGLNSWDNTRVVRQEYLLTDVLKTQLGFKGFVVSDWYGVHEGTRSTFLATVAAVNAGVDMAMLPFDYQQFITHVRWANRLGLISDERIDNAVRRILYAKFSLGLFDTRVSSMALTPHQKRAHQELARYAVAQSLVLLKNDRGTLPLPQENITIRVAGSAADNVGKQMGAWSIEWQGIDGNWPANTTSILAGIKEVAGQTTQIEFDADGQFSTDSPVADIGIAVVGESPYAEGWGDSARPSLSDRDLATINNLQQVSKTVIVILVTGRPLIITDEIDDWDSVVVAWLPGSEGAGVADVLFGKQSFTGTLPLPWPASIAQLPISPRGETSDGSTPLFPRYFGLY